ncbi:hypothetical protein [Rhodococcus sp. IEGM 1318]|uniref:hypothetical protein n=1 Tax=Rhodococcus sp. IEGM 1318 TaxID=3082226 RepID=UPI0029540216|nr:hypothetical protein [Rhodococcus sp. IEGM 1318]MDV8005021.1 hypothetical protein [Rhodococcus sp. IEGM 1318]
MRTVLGIDPGARATGLCVLSGDQILAHRTITSEGDYFPAQRLYVRDVVTTAVLLHDLHEAELIAIETINRPSWHMKGRAAVDPTALLATAEILGAILGFPWTNHVIQIRPNKNGSQPLGTYPGVLVSPGERRKAGWEARIGGGQLRHARSAYDVARLASRNIARNYSLAQENS